MPAEPQMPSVPAGEPGGAPDDTSGGSSTAARSTGGPGFSGSPESPGSLSHVVGEGSGARARMVDVSAKRSTARTALARARIVFPPGLLARVRAGEGPKGPVEEVARIAGVMAAKRTAEWIPLCHPLALDHVDVVFEETGPETLEVRCKAATAGRTGVEMEALTGAAAAALTVYDMTKALDKGIRIEALELLEKTGGKSGRWRAAGSAGAAGPPDAPDSARSADSAGSDAGP